jgi:thiamine-monophosphate kinase
MDLSDGLSEAVRQLSEASGVGATIDASALPIDPAARRWFERLGSDVVDGAITGGDDYELLIAVRPRTRRRLVAAERYGNTPLTKIGSCTAEQVTILREHGSDRPLPRGYAHFR